MGHAALAVGDLPTPSGF